jgi:hypothetical protein
VDYVEGDLQPIIGSHSYKSNDLKSECFIREWSPEHDKMGKGVTLSKEEIVVLSDLLNGLEL